MSARPATPPTTLPTTVGVGGAVLFPVSLPPSDTPPVGVLPPGLPVAPPKPAAPVAVPVELEPILEDSVTVLDEESLDDVEMVLCDD